MEVRKSKQKDTVSDNPEGGKISFSEAYSNVFAAIGWGSGGGGLLPTLKKGPEWEKLTLPRSKKLDPDVLGPAWPPVPLGIKGLLGNPVT